MHLEKPICTPPYLSEVSPLLPLKLPLTNSRQLVHHRCQQNVINSTMKLTQTSNQNEPRSIYLRIKSEDSVCLAGNMHKKMKCHNCNLKCYIACKMLMQICTSFTVIVLSVICEQFTFRVNTHLKLKPTYACSCKFHYITGVSKRK